MNALNVLCAQLTRDLFASATEPEALCYVLSVAASVCPVFTAQRVCIARTMASQDVCPSSCPSVCHTPVLSLNSYTYPQSFFTVG